MIETRNGFNLTKKNLLFFICSSLQTNFFVKVIKKTSNSGPNRKPQQNSSAKQTPYVKRVAKFDKKIDKIYFDGVVTETLPGVRFKVKIERSKGLEPLILECQTRAILKVKKVKILKGDMVAIELDPQDLAKGLIVARY
jgi:translation initiation factor IF-1